MIKRKHYKNQTIIDDDTGKKYTRTVHEVANEDGSMYAYIHLNNKVYGVYPITNKNDLWKIEYWTISYMIADKKK